MTFKAQCAAIKQNLPDLQTTKVQPLVPVTLNENVEKKKVQQVF